MIAGEEVVCENVEINLKCMAISPVRALLNFVKHVKHVKRGQTGPGILQLFCKKQLLNFVFVTFFGPTGLFHVLQVAVCKTFWDYVLQCKTCNTVKLREYQIFYLN